MKIIDLSMTIQSHWRWNVNHELFKDLEKGDSFQISMLTLHAHAFTHMDTPLHIIRNEAPYLEEEAAVWQ